MSREQEKLLQEMLYTLNLINTKIEVVYGRMGELSAKTSEYLRALDKKLDDIKKQAGRQRRQT